MEKKKVKVTIAGATYSLLTDETAAYTNELATDIDEKIKEIQSANPFITANQAAILVALDSVRLTRAETLPISVTKKQKRRSGFAVCTVCVRTLRSTR